MVVGIPHSIMLIAFGEPKNWVSIAFGWETIFCRGFMMTLKPRRFGLGLARL